MLITVVTIVMTVLVNQMEQHGQVIVAVYLLITVVMTVMIVQANLMVML